MNDIIQIKKLIEEEIKIRTKYNKDLEEQIDICHKKFDLLSLQNKYVRYGKTYLKIKSIYIEHGELIIKGPSYDSNNLTSESDEFYIHYNPNKYIYIPITLINNDAVDIEIIDKEKFIFSYTIKLRVLQTMFNKMVTD
jgi:hypothetical protein